jgi:hypothetical protein
MIVFVTNSDEATLSNYNVILKSLRDDDIKLMANDAIRENLIRCLDEKPDLPTFAMTHGTSISFKANDASVAFSIHDMKLFKQRQVFIYACFTANILGKLADEFGCIYWGYTGYLTAAYDHPKSKTIFEDIFEFVFQRFAIQRSKSEILEVIFQLKRNSDAAQERLIEIHNEDKSYDTMEGFYCLHQIWSNLRVYYRKGGDRIVHPEASLVDIFEKL